MTKLAANLTLLFNEIPFLDRFRAAADAGFKGVEYLFPYEYDAGALRRQLDDYGLTQVLINMPAGNWAGGDRGLACLPRRVPEFRAGVARAVEYATALGCRQVNCLAGVRPANLDAAVARQTLISNLQYAAPRLGAAGIRLLVEPINTRDMPGYLLNRSAEALEAIEAVGSDNLFLQYDVYHMQTMEGDLARTIEAHVGLISHIQIADVPGRHEPGTGEINYPFLFDRIARAGYSRWIGCEYLPATTTTAGLDWAGRYLNR